ncbi:MAG TPA: restriction endonuclease subunit S [Ktedonobacteraceae bacterium]
MSNDWPVVALHEILQPVSRPESVDPSKTYHILGAHWYAEGLYIKDTKAGSSIQANKVYRVEQGDFVYNRLFAWKGSFAVAVAQNHDCYVSNEFPTFAINQQQADAHYLWRYFSRTSAWEEALGLSTGGTPTSRNRLKEEKLLAIQIPLPPLDEQRRIVARIDELAAKIEEARGLRREVEKDTYSLLLGEYHRILKEADELPMSKVAPLVRRPVDIQLSQKYYELGIRSFGKGTFHKPPVTGTELGTKRIFKIEENDLLFNIVFAWEGAVAVAKREDYGRVGSHRFLTCVPIEGIATSSFLCFHFLTERGLEQLLNASPGSAGRNRTLGIQALENITVPIPSYEKQTWFEKLQKNLNQVNQIHSSSEIEIASILPSILDQAFKGEL